MRIRIVFMTLFGFVLEIILICVCCYLAHPLSCRNLAEMMAERSVQVDHSNIYRWVQKFALKLEAAYRRSGSKRSVGKSWRMDETYVKVNGQWKYLYRAVDKAGQSVDFLLTAHRDKKAALRLLRNAQRQQGLPDKVTIDKSGANTAALEALQEEGGAAIEIGQNKYRNNIVEQDHRAAKRVVRPMLGFKSFRSAWCALVGVTACRRLPCWSTWPRITRNDVI